MNAHTIAFVVAAAEPVTVFIAARVIVGLRGRLAEAERVRVWELGE